MKRSQEAAENKQRVTLDYIWTYYKLPILAGVIALAIVLSFVVSALTRKETVLHVMLVDCSASEDGAYMGDRFLEHLELDGDKYAVNIQTNYVFASATTGTLAFTSQSKFSADIGTQTLDVCGMLEADFLVNADADCFLDLSEYLTAEEQERLDGQLLRRNGQIIGIYADDLPGMAASGSYQSQENRGVLGVIYNTPRLECALAYLRYVAGL